MKSMIGNCFGHYDENDSLCSKCFGKKNCVIVTDKKKNPKFFEKPSIEEKTTVSVSVVEDKVDLEVLIKNARILKNKMSLKFYSEQSSVLEGVSIDFFIFKSKELILTVKDDGYCEFFIDTSKVFRGFVESKSEIKRIMKMVG